MRAVTCLQTVSTLRYEKVDVKLFYFLRQRGEKQRWLLEIALKSTNVLAHLLLD